jgi:glycerate 2-kinase
MEKELQKLRADAMTIFRAALEAVEPERAVLSHLERDGDILVAGGERMELPERGRVFVVGAGKAAGPMAAAVEKVLGNQIAEGAVVTRYGHGYPLAKVRLLEAGHPVPDEKGVAAAGEIIGILERAGDDDLVVCLLSGGGSALLPAPPEGIPLADKMAVTRLLLECGAGIGDINAVRKHLSRLKGGGLARLAGPARLLTLILSDVVGDPLEVIASGPTASDPTTFADALAVLDRYGLRVEVPGSVLRRLERGAAGGIPETLKPGDPAFDRCRNLLVGNNAMAVAAAAHSAEGLGYRTLILSTTITGETRHVAAVHGAMAREIVASGHPLPPPACLISGGETTVTVRGNGRGGRNQEFVLAAALEIRGLPGVLVFSAGTDGTDGPTEAAGAMADGTTVERAQRAGFDPIRHLENNDAYPLFSILGDLVITGPTHTNVMDLRLVLAETF